MDGSAYEGAADPGFVADVVRSVEVWSKAPLLPLLTIGINLLYGYPGTEVPLVSTLALFVFAGWRGVERAWYLRLFREVPFHIGEIPGLLRAYLVRYLLLGLFVSIPVLIVILLAGLYGVQRSTFLVLVTLVGLAVDVLLTFVTPAITFTTDRALEAIGIGLRMLRESWPGAALYVLVPPLALEIVFTVIRLHTTVRLASSVASVLIALV